MLTYFSVENLFDNKPKMCLDFRTNVDNQRYVYNSIINKSVVYDNNVSQYGQFMLALFDIVSVFNGPKENINYASYLSEETNFEYHFKFDETILVYRYTKKLNKICAEELIIDGKTYLALTFADVMSEYKTSVKKFLGYSWGLSEDIKNIISQFLSFVDRMVYVDIEKPFLKIGLSIEIPSLEKLLGVNDNLAKLNFFLCSLDMNTELELCYNKDKVFLCDVPSYLPYKEICSTGTQAAIQIFYWIRLFYQFVHPSFLYISQFDNCLHPLVSIELKEAVEQLDIQSIINFTHNTHVINWSHLIPEGCFIINENGVRSLAESCDEILSPKYNLEKLFRDKYRKNSCA